MYSSPQRAQMASLDWDPGEDTSPHPFAACCQQGLLGFCVQRGDVISWIEGTKKMLLLTQVIHLRTQVIWSCILFEKLQQTTVIDHCLDCLSGSRWEGGEMWKKQAGWCLSRHTFEIFLCFLETLNVVFKQKCIPLALEECRGFFLKTDSLSREPPFKDVLSCVLEYSEFYFK